jgi:hypothetical protein
MLDKNHPLYKQMADDVRKDRHIRLSYTDWTQVADAPVDKEAWAAYRQALRDITLQEDFPFQVQWPVPPFKQE